MTPAVLLAQGGGHDHVLTLGVSVGPTALRMALLAAIPVVAGFALLRGFLAEPDRRTRTAVIMTAGGAAVLELLLSGGLDLPRRLVPLLLALLIVPLYLVLSRDPRFAPAVGRARRLAPWVFWPAAAVAAGLFARAWLTGDGQARTATLLHTGVVIALVALVWFVVARPGLSVRLGAGALAMVLLAGAAHAVVLRPAEPVPGVPVAASVETGAGAVDVLVVPNLPGWNLVRVSTMGAEVGTRGADFAPAPATPGTTGGWAAVKLPPGRGEVLIRHGGGTGSVTVDTGAGDSAPESLAGPDGVECAGALLGRAVAVAGPVEYNLRCPADELGVNDAGVLRDIVETIAVQGHPSLGVVTDDSRRGRRADHAVRVAAARAGIDVRPVDTVAARSGPLVVVAGWRTAAQALRTYPNAVIHPAPWLVTDPPLAPGMAAVPDDGPAGAYQAGLRQRYPEASPSMSGYRAWYAGRGVPGTPEIIAGPTR